MRPTSVEIHAVLRCIRIWSGPNTTRDQITQHVFEELQTAFPSCDRNWLAQVADLHTPAKL